MTQTVKKRLKITLKSDMCCGTGTGNGVMVDTETSFDELGLPVIPGKRLKGLLRECCEFLADHDKGVSKRDVERLFGTNSLSNPSDSNSGIIRVSNGVIDDYPEIKKELLNLPPYIKTIVTKNTIEKTFTQLRSQTAIDENEIADDLSLRTIQTIKRDTKFYADISLSVPTGDKSDVDLIDRCAKLLRQIGLNRTRGYGEVKCELLPEEICVDEELKIDYSPKNKICVAPYTIRLLDDVVIAAGSNQSKDYISGSMVIGAFAKYTEKYDWFQKVVLEDTVFSNAYIAHKRGNTNYTCQPMPLSCYEIKYREDQVYNLADGHKRNDDEQYVQSKGYAYHYDYVWWYKEVGKAVEYHNAVNAKEPQLFTYSKILKGQFFQGEIEANEGALTALKEVLSHRDHRLLFGGSKSAQYAAAEFIMDDPTEKKDIPKPIRQKMRTEFLSDVIVYDDFGNNSSKTADLVALIKEELRRSCPDLDFECTKIYTKFVTVGGFNKTWSLPRQQYTAFAKGTVLELSMGSDSTEKKVVPSGRVGLLTNEGYGLFALRESNQKTKGSEKRKIHEGSNGDIGKNKSVSIIKAAYKGYLINRYRNKAMELAGLDDTNLGLPNVMRLKAAYQSAIRSEAKDKSIVFETEFDKTLDEKFKKKNQDMSKLIRERNDVYSIAQRAKAEFNRQEKAMAAFIEDVYDMDAYKLIRMELYKEFLNAFINQVKINKQIDKQQVNMQKGAPKS